LVDADLTKFWSIVARAPNATSLGYLQKAVDVPVSKRPVHRGMQACLLLPDPVLTASRNGHDHEKTSL